MVVQKGEFWAVVSFAYVEQEESCFREALGGHKRGPEVVIY